jgi:hypothetical protein
MFKEVDNAEVFRGFKESAARVRTAYGMRAVAEPRNKPKG